MKQRPLGNQCKDWKHAQKEGKRGMQPNSGFGEREEDGAVMPPPSKLAKLLVKRWSWGQLSAPMVQAFAEAARDDGLALPEISRLSKLGGGGKYPGNMQRDMVQAFGKQGPFQNATSVFQLLLTSKKHVSVPEDVTFLLPHKFFASLYTDLPEVFISSMLGGDKKNISTFWRAMRNHPNVVSRPGLSRRPDLAQVIPIALHGDGVAYMQPGRSGSKSLEVLSWSSMLTKDRTKVASFVMFLICKASLKTTGIGRTWPRVWKILIWSLEALALGTWPLLSPDGVEFEDKTSIDYINRGKPLASGFCAVVFLLRSDLEFLSNHFHLNSPNSNQPCALCKADRQSQSKPWTDCRPCAAWRRSIWNAQEWARAHPECHPLFAMRGSGLDIYFPDLMHCKHLGTDQYLLGSVLTYLVKHFLKGSVTQNIDFVWELLQQWFKD